MESKARGKSNTMNQHRKSVFDIVLPVIDESDLLLEILDAKFIEETRNKYLEEKIISKGKKIIYVLNKIDLANLPELYKKIDLENLKPYVLFSCRMRQGVRELRKRIKIMSKKILKEKSKEESKFDRQVKVGIIGYPNTGKSSVINILVGRAVAPASPVAGFTRGVKKLKLSEDVMLFDTPGIIPKEENPTSFTRDLKKHGLIGVQTWHKTRAPDFVVAGLMQKYPGALEKFYNVESNEDSEILIEKVGRIRYLIKKGNLVDIDRTARSIIKDWQEGKISVD